MNDAFASRIMLGLVGGIWAFFGVAELFMPRRVRAYFELLIKQPRLLPATRLTLGALLILGSLQNEESHRLLIYLGFFLELGGLIGLLQSDQTLKDYLHWLKIRPLLTFRLMGLIHVLIGGGILKSVF